MKKLYSGDYWSLVYTIYDKNGQPFNLAGWQIRAEFYGYNSISILRTYGVPNGPGNIDILDINNGKIRIKFFSNETNFPPGYYFLEIEITKTDTGEKYTVVKEQYEVLEDRIRW